MLHACVMTMFVIFFFKQKTAYEMRISDWSSDVCSSDLAHHPLGKDEWVKLFRKTFKFMGGEIVGEFLMSTGYLPGAHHEACPVHREIVKLSPPWMRG